MASTSYSSLVKDIPTPPFVPSPPSALDHFKYAAAQQIASILSIDDVQKVFEGIEIAKGSGASGMGGGGGGGKKKGKGAEEEKKKDDDSNKKKDKTPHDFNVAIPRFRLKEDPKVSIKKLVDEFKPTPLLSEFSAEGVFLYVSCATSLFTKLVLNQVHERTHLRPSASSSTTTTTPADPTSSSTSKPLPNPASLPYGNNLSGHGKKVVIEFSSPNIAKPFHAGHLRSTIIGAFLCNLYRANGWEVVSMNYLGDWGKQFGLLAVGYNKYGSEEKLKENAIIHLFDIYVRINKEAEADPTIHDEARAFFAKMEADDLEAIALWKKFRELSIAKYKQAYARLNIEFDVYSGESQVPQERMNECIKVLQEKQIATEDQNALVIDLKKYKLEKPVVRKKDGTTLYLTRDIGEAIGRYEKYKFDKMVYVIASQQDLHAAQFFKVLDLMGHEWAKNCVHVNFGMILGMSSRKGTVRFLDDILDGAKETMHEQMKSNEAKYAAVEDPERTSDVIGITGVKIQDMAGKRINNYEWKDERVLSFEGDTGPYLQYAHVRLCSVERKVAPDIVLPPPEQIASTVNTDLLVESQARDLVSLLAQWPDVVKFAFRDHQPSTIVTYLYRITHAVSSAWEVLNVKGSEPDVALARLFLFNCARDVIGTAMRLLTLEPLERM